MRMPTSDSDCLTKHGPVLRVTASNWLSMRMIHQKARGAVVIPCREEEADALAGEGCKMVAVLEPTERKTFSVKQGKEVVVRMKNRTGILSELAKLVSEKGVNVLALNGAVYGEDCVVRLMTDDNLRAKDVLAAKNYVPQEESVVVLDLSHKPGMLKRMAETVTKAGIDIRHVYATAAEEDEHCLLVFHSSNDDHALVVLKQSQAGSPAATNALADDQTDRDQNANMVSEGGPAY